MYRVQKNPTCSRWDQESNLRRCISKQTLYHFTVKDGFYLNTLFTGNPKRVLWQTVKTQMKCFFSSGSALSTVTLLRFKQPSWTEIHHSLKNSTCDPLKYTMGSPILIVSIDMRKSIRIQRVIRQQSVKSVVSSHSKEDQRLVFKTDYS